MKICYSLFVIIVSLASFIAGAEMNKLNLSGGGRTYSLDPNNLKIQRNGANETISLKSGDANVWKNGHKIVANQQRGPNQNLNHLRVDNIEAIQQQTHEQHQQRGPIKNLNHVRVDNIEAIQQQQHHQQHDGDVDDESNDGYNVNYLRVATNIDRSSGEQNEPQQTVYKGRQRRNTEELKKLIDLLDEAVAEYNKYQLLHGMPIVIVKQEATKDEDKKD